MFVRRWGVLLLMAIILIIVVITTTVVLVKDENTKPRASEETDRQKEPGGALPITEDVTSSSLATTTLQNIFTPSEEAKPEHVISQWISEFHKHRKSTQQPGNIVDILSSRNNKILDGIVCTACLSITDSLIQYSKNHTPQEFREYLHSVCVDLQIQKEEVCAGLIDLHLDTVLYILDNTQGLTSRRICGVMFQSHGCSDGDGSMEWTVDVNLGSKPEVNGNYDSRTNASEALTIIQITDIHYDPMYMPHGNAECGATMCCRSDQGIPERPKAEAGYWGDYRDCDIPWQTVQNTLQQIKESHKKIDYIYMTGDIVDHGIWDTSIPKNTESIKKVLKALKMEFPNIPVYPILGNHEATPTNTFAPHNISDKNVSTNWLYELSAELWSVWLPPETKETILHGGFYTVLARPGFRIIALNSNLGYTANWWSIYDPKDQEDQLKWLAETLLKAEKNGEKVHILSHMPSGFDSCLKAWSREFHKIIDRFENTVTAQFNGHSHKDHFYIYYATDEPTRATNVAFNGGSVTPFSNLNPNYKAYSMDSANYDILDSETWIYNLTEANLKGNATPKWFKLYSFKEAYGVESLSPTSLDRLVQNMATNRSLLEQYSRYFVKEADTALARGCDTKCLEEKLCEIATAETGNSIQCNILMKKFQTAHNIVADDSLNLQKLLSQIIN